MDEHGFEPKGVVLHRAKVTVAELTDAYIQAGMPTRKMRPKRPATITNENACLKPVRAYFGAMRAAAITVGSVINTAIGESVGDTLPSKARIINESAWYE